MRNKVIFLDRDGILNKELGDYVTQPQFFELNEGCIPFLLASIDMGYKLVVITNQGGIAKGLYSHEDLHAIHSTMKAQFLKRGIRFNDILYCPHHPVKGLCLCRKPGSLLIEKASHRFSVNKSDSFMVGDKMRDVEAAEKAGIRGFCVPANSSLNAYIKYLK